LRDGVAVDRTKRNNPHDEEIEGTLWEIELVFSLHAYAFYIYLQTCRRSRHIALPIDLMPDLTEFGQHECQLLQEANVLIDFWADSRIGTDKPASVQRSLFRKKYARQDP